VGIVPYPVGIRTDVLGWSAAIVYVNSVGPIIADDGIATIPAVHFRVIVNQLSSDACNTILKEVIPNYGDVGRACQGDAVSIPIDGVLFNIPVCNLLKV